MVSSSIDKNRNLWQMLTFGRLLYPDLLPIRDKFWYASKDQPSTTMCQISSQSVYFVTLVWRKAPNFAVFWTLAFCDVTN